MACHQDRYASSVAMETSSPSSSWIGVFRQRCMGRTRIDRVWWLLGREARLLRQATSRPISAFLCPPSHPSDSIDTGISAVRYPVSGIRYPVSGREPARDPIVSRMARATPTGMVHPVAYRRLAPLQRGQKKFTPVVPTLDTHVLRRVSYEIGRKTPGIDDRTTRFFGVKISRAVKTEHVTTSTPSWDEETATKATNGAQKIA